MAAPKGNKYAVGNPNSGRPPIYNLEEEAKLIEEWSKKSTSLNLNQFANERDIPADYFFEWNKKSEVFSNAYKKAKAQIASRRESLVHKNEFNYGVYNRQLCVYDLLTHSHERDEKAYEASLKKDESQNHKEITLKVKYDGGNRAEIQSSNLST